VARTILEVKWLFVSEEVIRCKKSIQLKLLGLVLFKVKGKSENEVQDGCKV